MKLSAVCASVLCLAAILSSCTEPGPKPIHLDEYFTSMPPADTSLVIEPVYADEFVPEGYEPMRDDLVLRFSVGDTERHYLVNPYSTRTVPLCHDPFCTHELDAECCPEVMLSSFSPILWWNGKFILCGADTAEIDWNEPDGNGGWIVTKKTVPWGGIGIIRYDPLALGRKAILKAGDRPDSRSPFIDMTLYGDDLYYYDRVFLEDNSLREHLYRLNLKTGKIADLGEYLGYQHVIVKAGYIWNYYGFLNPNGSELWETNADYWIRCDLDNRNPERIPVRHEPCADLDGYIMPRADPLEFPLRYLLYTGDLDDPHVYEAQRGILSWENGAAVEEELTDDNEAILFYHDYRTGEDGRILEDWNTEYTDWIPYLTCVYADRYAIFEMREPPKGRNTQGRLRFYMRADIFKGECAPILAEN